MPIVDKTYRAVVMVPMAISVSAKTHKEAREKAFTRVFNSVQADKSGKHLNYNRTLVLPTVLNTYEVKTNG